MENKCWTDKRRVSSKDAVHEVGAEGMIAFLIRLRVGGMIAFLTCLRVQMRQSLGLSKQGVTGRKKEKSPSGVRMCANGFVGPVKKKRYRAMS